MDIEYDDSFAGEGVEDNPKPLENVKDSESPRNTKLLARENRRLMLLSQVDELIEKLVKREGQNENIKFIEKVKSFNFKSDVN